MPQIIIVSNRLPISVRREKGRLKFYPSLGGLATGLSSYVHSRSLWIGWPGIASDDLTDEDKQTIVEELSKHKYYPVFLSRRQIEEFYNGYSNQLLWLNFHNLKMAKPTDDRYKRWWQSYREVNKKFADVTLNLAEANSRIWIHDYQLLLTPEMLRSGRTDFNIGLFVHIPFPDANTLSKLGERKKLINGMLGADVIGFHTGSYVSNFISNCLELGINQTHPDQLSLDGRVVKVSDFPMGIDYEKYASANKSKAVKKAVKEYSRRYKKQKVIAAVDRLDPSKGLLERLQAYKLFLGRYPELHGRITFCMVVAPSRISVPAYRSLSKKIAELVNMINLEFGNKNWQPVDYIDRAIPFEEVTAIFRIADVAFITPLKDGMNLAAKEFVASAHRNSALILSETAGASEELKDALIVNPGEPETMVDALHQALTMKRRELRRRLKRMKQQLAINTVQEWAQDFVGTLNQPVSSHLPRTRSLKGRILSSFVQDYRLAGQRLLLLDYDGSLVSFAEDYTQAVPPQSLIDLLKKICQDPKNEVVLISGRDSKDLSKWFGKLPMHLVAEHGATVKLAGQKAWQVIEEPDVAWKEEVKPILEKYRILTPGARIETKPHTLVWHYRGASPYYAQKNAVTIRRILKPILKVHGLEIMQGNKVLEIKNPGISKGKAAETWLAHNYDFIFAIGDDKTDEELFAVLPEEAYSIKIGRGRTQARFRLSDHKETIKLLKRLAK